MPEPFDYSVVDAALEKCGCKQSAIIAVSYTHLTLPTTKVV